ncbi:MAG: hypothetical protein LBG84_01720 [Treponema sp.]|jgi:hypothetical protein|nr:hypothetical protein [Treponema sp.]
MKSSFFPRAAFFLTGLGLLFFVSCSARIAGRLGRDSSGTVRVQAGLEPEMAALIRGLGGLAGGGTGSGAGNARPVLDAAALNRSLRAAPGITSADLRNSGPEKLEGTIAFSRAGEVLSGGGAASPGNRFIRYQAPDGAAPGRLGVHLERAAGPRILAMISPDAADYLSALMAPIATGENLGKAEYLDLVASIYGRGLAKEIAASTIKVAVTFPGPVQSVRGGTFSGGEARFEIPLPELLTLEQPLDYEAAWKP